MDSREVAPAADGSASRADLFGLGNLSEFVEWELVRTLYSQLPSLLVGGVALAAAAFIGWLRTANVSFLVWSIAIALVVIGRVGLDLLFNREIAANRIRVGRESARRWRNRFTLGAWAMGVNLGIAGCAIVMPVDPFLRLLLLTTQMIIIMGAVTRNAGCPAAAKGQIFLGLSPIVVACVLARTPDDLIFLGFTIFGSGGALGSVRFLHRQTVRLLRTNEANIALAREANDANAELAAANRRLEEMAVTDALTQIGNRRRFDDVLLDEVRRAQRDGSDLSLLMLDIDAFKGFNDLYGHQAGDACLRDVAAALSGALRRPTDVVARYGGEEFGAILPRTDAVAAASLAEQIRARIEALGIPSAAGPAGVVTVSVGLVTHGARSSYRPQDLIRAADEALYAAKAAGRNCVRASPDSAPEFIDAPSQT